MSTEKPIKFLTLYFPHGATVEAADNVARLACREVNAGVSQGGFAIIKDHGDHCEFSDDSMQYTYGHDRSLPRGKTP